METRTPKPPIKPFRFVVPLLCAAALGWAACTAYLNDRDEISLSEFCKGPSERPRLACMNVRPADASPMPPQG